MALTENLSNPARHLKGVLLTGRPLRSETHIVPLQVSSLSYDTRSSRCYASRFTISQTGHRHVARHVPVRALNLLNDKW